MARRALRPRFSFGQVRVQRTVLCAAALIMLAGATVGSARGDATGAAFSAVVVELNSDPGAVHAAKARTAGSPLTDEELEAYRGLLRAEQAQFLANLESRGIPFEVGGTEPRDWEGNPVPIVYRYTLVLNGIALKVAPEALAELAAMPQVKGVHRDRVLVPALDRSVPHTYAPRVYGESHELTRFDDLREGFEGQGMHIAVVDSGVDWSHEMFGLDPAPPRLGIEPATAVVGRHEKVVYYLPLADAVADGNGHGTHVASTAAGYLGFTPGLDGIPANGDDEPLHGVAPQARLLAYKVCSDLGTLTVTLGCPASAIVMAFEDAVSPRTVNGFPKPVAHVINVSLSGAGAPDSVTAVAADNAVRLGAVVVAAAGNASSTGTIGAPAAGRRVIAVGAVTDAGSGWSADVLEPSSIPVDTTGAVIPATQLPLAPGPPRLVQLWPMLGTPRPPPGSMAQRYVFVRGGELPANWPASARGRIGLVRATTPAVYAAVADGASAAGAIGVLLISNAPNPTAVRAPIPAALISVSDGDYLAGLMSGTPGVDPPSGTVSNHPLRLNPFLSPFTGAIAPFSSGGPVQGFGQVKPDVAAPGVNVLAAVPPGSSLGAGAIGGLRQGQGLYAEVSGTSMATPHVAGAVALVKQAHPSWDADMVRTALINTATNPRDADGVPAPDTWSKIVFQGGGLIDVFEALHAKALMGIAGDGITGPSILGSHSFGRLPFLNSRCTKPETLSAPVVIRDITGQGGGTYDLSVRDNGGLTFPGMSVNVPSRISVPRGGEATFRVTATLDGSRYFPSEFHLQWFVEARPRGRSGTLRMPFYVFAARTDPKVTSVETQVFTGTLPASDRNAQLVPDVTYKAVPLQVGARVFKLEAVLDFDELIAEGVNDMDLFLLGPDGSEIARSVEPGGPERISVRVDRAGTYTYRVTGFRNGPTDFELTSRQLAGDGRPPVLSPVEVTPKDGRFRFTLTWQPLGSEQGFEVERCLGDSCASYHVANWERVASVAGNVTSVTLRNQPAGRYSFRVRTLAPGEQAGCTFISNPSNVQTIVAVASGVN